MWYRGAMYRAKLTSNAIVRKFPRVICFRQTPEETLAALESIRKGLHRSKKSRVWFKPNINPNKEVSVTGYFSMNDVEEISTSAALVLAAEYERRTMYMDEYPPLFDLEKWDRKIIYKLEQIGFFKGFGFDPTYNQGDQDFSDVLTVPFYSGTKSEMKKVDEKLLKLVEHIDPEFRIDSAMLLALNSAVGEAATNTREHAYREDHEFKYPHVGLWWATGAASIAERKIVVSLYDQGVSIPVSYTKLPFFSSISSILHLFDPRESSEYANDATLIQAATRYGNSGRKLNSDGRSAPKIGGFGLPQIKDAIDLCGGGSLMILSRGGRYIYELRDGQSAEQLDTFNCSVGGTLIEWAVTLPEPVH